jgi:hypothetical protein
MMLAETLGFTGIGGTFIDPGLGALGRSICISNADVAFVWLPAATASEVCGMAPVWAPPPQAASEQMLAARA